MHAGVLRHQESVWDPMEMGVRDGCEAPCAYQEPKPAPLCQQVLLTTEPPCHTPKQ